MKVRRILSALLTVSILLLSCVFVSADSSFAVPEHKLPANSGITVQAEDYDNGGEGVGFHDTNDKNDGGQYRTDPVGIGVGSADGPDKGLDVGWTNDGEWLNYTIDVEKADTYNMDLYLASPNDDKKMTVKVNGTEAFKVDVPNTGDWQKYQILSDTVKLSAGKNVIQLFMTTGGMNIDKFTLSSPAFKVIPEHVLKADATLTVEAEDYDNGGEGVAFHDTNAKNEGGRYRQDTVGISYGSELGDSKGFDVGWTNAGEWLNYTINVEKAGNYYMGLILASPNSDQKLSVKVDGAEAFFVDIPNTGAWQLYDLAVGKLDLKEGKNVIQIFLTTGGVNIDKFTLGTEKPQPKPKPIVIEVPELTDPVREPKPIYPFIYNFTLKKPANIAKLATAEASSYYSEEFSPTMAIDGVKKKLGSNEWVSNGETNPWITLDWSEFYTINKIVIYDRISKEDNALGGTLLFSDGTKIDVSKISTTGSGKVITFKPKIVKWIEFDIKGSGTNVGLAEIEVYGAKSVKN